MRDELNWYDVLAAEDLPEGRVTTVTAGHRSLALTHFEGKVSALDNRCPHQGGPLGEGSIEKGWLRCPWHGWDYHPCTGKSPGCYDDGIETFAVEIREGRIHVGVPREAPRVRTVTDVMAETMVAWGIRHVFGMVGHIESGARRRAPRAREGRGPDLHRHPTRRRGQLRGLGLRQTHGPPRRVSGDRRAGLDESADRTLRRQGRPGARARTLRASRHTGARTRRVPGSRSRCRLRTSECVATNRASHQPARRTREPRGQERRGPEQRVDADLPRRSTNPSRRRGHRRWSDGADDADHDHAARVFDRRRRADRARVEASGDRRRPRRALRDGRRRGVGRRTRRPGAHHLQGEGTDRRRPSARGRPCSAAAERRSPAGS